MSDNDEQQQQESQEHSQKNKLDNPDSIPTAGGKKLGEEHAGESKMLRDNARSPSIDERGDGDDIQKRLEGKKVADKDDGDSGKKESTMHKMEEKLHMKK